MSPPGLWSGIRQTSGEITCHHEAGSEEKISGCPEGATTVGG
ncbi:hypothetical protein EC32303_3391 [Escherichia coli 3.2303]|nr:hypothetical protein EC32303_3391 [Escherichia coli 3.2303]EKI25656.1 hypothetical protein ECTW00353_3327 [Escherichia coli TW00353]